MWLVSFRSERFPPRNRARLITGSLTAFAVESDEPPTEFRIFKVGVNTTTRGDFVFDAESARSVMAEYERHGIDVMLDLEHLSLDQESNAYDPDARGWCKLELRNGELWATQVRWTDDGAARLGQKRQRYISPAFEADKKTGRIASLLNIAITALPATNNLTPLVAASSTSTTTEYRTNMLDPKIIEEAMAAITAGDAKKALEILTSLIASAAGGGAPAEEPAPAEMGAAPPVPPEDQAMMAAARQLTALTGKPPAETVEELVRCRSVAADVAAREAKLAADRAALEADERDGLVVEMVTLRAESPATAWAEPLDATDRAKRKPAEPWASMPIASLRARVAKLSGGKPTAPATKQAPTPSSGNAFGLTDSELVACKRTGCDPETYAALKAPRPS